MDWPDLLPSELDYCLRLRGYELVLGTLVDHADGDVVRFFEAAGSDETWAVEHREVIEEILAWLTKEYACGRLRHRYARRVVETVHQHSQTLVEMLPKDVGFSAKRYLTKGNSLMYASQSLFFREVIEREYKPDKKILWLSLEEIPKDVFQIVEESVNNGVVQDLWRLELKDLLRVIKRAGAWDLRGLVTQVAEVIRRYVDLDNGMKILRIAYDHSLPELMQVTCEAVGSVSFGVNFFVTDEAQRLGVEITEFRARNEEMLHAIAPIVWRLALRGKTSVTLEHKRLLPELVHLHVLDLEGSEAYDLELIDELPPLTDLNMNACSWLSDAIGAHFLQHQPGLQRLHLNENRQLEFETYRAITFMKGLEELYCVYCGGLTDGFLAMIARDCPSLTRLSIAWCPQISDVGLQGLGHLRPNLAEVDISHCTRVSADGIQDLLRPGHRLRKLVMTDLPLVSEDAMFDAVALSPTLKHLDVRGCGATPAGLSSLRKAKPNLEVLA